MVDGITKMEADEKEGRGYASGRHVREGNMEGEEPASRKRYWLQMRCRQSPAGVVEEQIFENYEKRMEDENVEKSAAATTGCTEPTKDYVQSTSKLLAPMQTT
jgi:hypothetical protein